MGLQFVVGDVRTGKSGILYQEGIRRQEEEGGRVLFVVPEQATLVVQQELIACHPRHAFQDMDVLSFGRLAYHVFEELEITLPPLLDETGKAMVLRKALSGMEKNLQIFRGSMYKPGFIQELKSVLSELDQYRITGKMLKEAMEKLGEEDRLALKIREVESIQKAFRAEIGDLFHTGEEVLDVLAAHVPESVYLAEASLYLDGFTGFTPVQYHLLGVLMKHVKDIWVSIPLPSPQMLQQENRPHERYSLSKGMAIRLQQLAAENGVEVYPIRQSPLKQPFLAPVSIIQGGNPREELVWVREKIEALVREKGVHYRDMAIVTGDLSIYGRLAKEVFSREVPCFIDETRHLQSNLVILLLESALEVAAAQFSYESVFRYVKNGLRKSLPEESLLENYVLAFRIRGAKKWEEAWIRGAGNFSQEDMDLVNKARERVGAPLLHLKTALQKETVEEKLKGVRGFWEEIQGQKLLEAYIEEAVARQENEQVQEYGQIWEKVDGLLTQYEALLGRQKMSLQIFLEVLKAGLSGLHMGIIPPTLDRLVVGDIRRTRLGELQYLFFVGMNEGTVPAVGKEKGIFSDRDRDRLEKAGVVLAPTSLQESFTENFYLYWLMARPSRYLFLSYSRLNSASETLRPSYLLNRIRRESRFQEEILLEDGELREAQMVDIREGFTYLSLHIQAFMTGQLMKEEEERFLLVFGWVKKNPRWEPVLKKILAGARLENRAEELPADVAAYLFGQGENMSVTRLERFAACEYAFFLQYGLKLQEREIFMLEASDLGELYHGAIDRFFYLASRYNLSVNQMEEETRKTLVKEAVDFVTRNFRHTILQSSAANQYRTERIRRTVDRTIWAIQKQLRMGDFQLAGHETAFGDLEKGTLLLQVNDNRTIRLLGKIDRVDVARSQNGDLVRIIDYKTGSQHFDYAKIEAGLQLQLLLYLYATLQERSVKLPGNHQIPAGLYYFHVQDPVMEVVSLPDVEHSEEANMLYEEELLKAMRMEGLTNASREVLLHGEKEFTSGKSRLLQQVELDKEGELKENGAVAGSRQMENLMDYALQKATDLGRGMFEGHMRVNPYVYGKKSPCDYCLYRTICGFDDEVKGYHKRQLYQRKAEDMWRKLRKEEEDGHQLDEGTTGSN